MNLIKKLSLGVSVLAVALVLSSATANAQQIYKATFELPFEAQIGSTVVEPGQYSIVVEELQGQKLIRFHGETEAVIIAVPANVERVADKGRLTFVTVDGLPTLKKFDAGLLGEAFVFPVHRAKGERAALNGVDRSTVIDTH